MASACARASGVFSLSSSRILASSAPGIWLSCAFDESISVITEELKAGLRWMARRINCSVDASTLNWLAAAAMSGIGPELGSTIQL